MIDAFEPNLKNPYEPYMNLLDINTLDWLVFICKQNNEIGIGNFVLEVFQNSEAPYKNEILGVPEWLSR